jgi:hypothetical protein
MGETLLKQNVRHQYCRSSLLNTYKEKVKDACPRWLAAGWAGPYSAQLFSQHTTITAGNGAE